jgi:hypothetical protein
MKLYIVRFDGPVFRGAAVVSGETHTAAIELAKKRLADYIHSGTVDAQEIDGASTETETAILVESGDF